LPILPTVRSQNEQEGEKALAELDTQIMWCVEKGLAHFGSNIPQVILDNIRIISGLKCEDIIHKPDEFETSLDCIFHPGSALVKKAIIDEIKAKFGLPPQNYQSLKEAFEAASSPQVTRQDEKRRSRMETYCDILKVIGAGTEKPTQIMFKANLSWKVLQSYLKSLEAQGLLLVNSEHGKSLFRLSEKGFQLLSQFLTITEDLNILTKI
jgi:predicted transcriptional regulator